MSNLNNTTMFNYSLNSLDLKTVTIGAIASSIALFFYLAQNPEKLSQIIELFKKTPLSKKLNINTDSGTYKGMKDYEIALEFQKAGFGYNEEYKRELGFDLHSKTKGKFSYKQICKAAEYLCLGDFNEYKIDIPKSDMKFYKFTRVITFLFFIIFFVSTLILLFECSVYTAPLKEILRSSNNIFFSIYFILFMSHINEPISMAKKVERFLEKETIFKS